MMTLEVNSFTARSEKGNEPVCPYCYTAADICMASLSSMSMDTQRRVSYCDSEGYDNCPIFLAKSLRMR